MILVIDASMAGSWLLPQWPKAKVDLKYLAILMAVGMSAEDLESLDIMGNERLLTDIRAAIAELSAGPATPLSKDEALHLIS